MKKKLYWWVQQLNRIGGTEMVSIDLVNSLVEDYDITLVSTVKLEGETPFRIDPRIKIMSLEIPTRCERYDYLSKKYLKHFRIFSYLGLVFQIGHHYVFRKNHYRKIMEKKILEDDATLICSSIDTYMLAPKKGKVYFHYHFGSESFFRKDTYPMVKMSRTPDKWIFLSKTTMDEIIQKRPDYKDISTYIYNPIRFEPKLIEEYHNNNILFVGRYADQKDPLLALNVAKELKQRNFSFKLRMFGDGPLKEDIKKYQKNNNLDDVVEINEFSNNIYEEMSKSDLLLLTSKYEGFGLVMGEANAMSIPWISSHWGNTVDEMLENSGCGIIVNSREPKDYADEIEKLLNDKDRLLKMKKASYEVSKKLSKEAIIPLWKNILD